MGKIKINLVSGTSIEKPLISCFKGTNANYIVLDNESNGSMGLPIIIISKLNGTNLEKIIDPNEWGAVKENLRTIISGTPLPYLAVPDTLSAPDDFFTQLTLPVASYDLLKSVYAPPVQAAPEAAVPAPAAPVPEVPAAPVVPTVQTPEAGVAVGVMPSAPAPEAQAMPNVSPVMPEAPVNPAPTVPVTPEVPTQIPPQGPVNTPVDTPVTPTEEVPQNIPVNTPVSLPDASSVNQMPMPGPVNTPVTEPVNVPPVEAVPVNPVPVASENPVPSVPPVMPAVSENDVVPTVPNVVPAVSAEAPVQASAPAIDLPQSQPAPISGDEEIMKIKETFMKSCENMFDALMKKFQNK